MECLETDTKRETDPKRHKGRWAAPALSLDSLTHRCHPSLSSSCRCPSLGLGAGEVGVGHRAQGLGVLKVLPLRSWPGCVPKCRGSGATHHTTGEGTNWRSVSSGISLLTPDHTRCTLVSKDPSCCPLKFQVSHRTVQVGRRIHSGPKRRHPGQEMFRKELMAGNPGREKGKEV